MGCDSSDAPVNGNNTDNNQTDIGDNKTDTGDNKTDTGDNKTDTGDNKTDTDNNNDTEKTVEECTESHKVWCDNKCIDPMTNKAFCGAKYQGKCNSELKDSDDYQGENCDNLKKGNRTYKCNEGKCVIVPCGSDQKEDENGNCVNKDNECKDDSCEKSCGDKVLCENECRDPLSDNHYCGAKIYTSCNEKQNCENGTCVAVGCTGEQQLCKDKKTGKQVCTDIKSDQYHCGKCESSCHNHPFVSHLSFLGCDNGKCKYKCSGETTLCQNETTLTCADTKTDRDHCGTCFHKCGENQGCDNGVCKDDPCGETECYFGGECIKNDFTKCGHACVNCKDVTNAYEGTCDDNAVCHVGICVPIVYHLEGEPGNYKCVKNSEYACGPANKVEYKNCHEMPHSVKVECNLDAAECHVMTCEDGWVPSERHLECVKSNQKI